MNYLSKIAILDHSDSGLTFELDELRAALSKRGIESKLFSESESILTYVPDCVISTSPQNAKLTPFPTYGLINRARDHYLETPRLLRNILTYDAYLAFSPLLQQMLGDIMFGARKLNSFVQPMNFFSASIPFKYPQINKQNPEILIFEPEFEISKFKGAIYKLLETFEHASVLTFSIDSDQRYPSRFKLAATLEELNAAINAAGIVICLEGGDNQQQSINTTVIKAIASSAIVITSHTDLLESYFGDSLYYIPRETFVDTLPAVIKKHLTCILQNIDEANLKCKKSHEIFSQHFQLDSLLDNFQALHEKNLVAKGYLPNPNPDVENKLPSVTYIMRTGGKHRPFLERALDCLVAQKYPDLRVIFVTHVKVPFINEIIQQYPTLKFKVIESIKSRRSEAIRDGMAAVETDLFGLFDDDDELYPNHVRSLVKTMWYHSNRDWRGQIGMVYSGSIHADDTYPVFERTEFHDHSLVHKNEKRAIEHFKFYSSVLMSQHAWFMPNGWLARSSLIDEELLTDPALDTCEDLYFELQIAQKAHFAFSVEVSAVHHFHHLGNSTIDDSYKHLPDTQRIALRNFSRVFPVDGLYDTQYCIVGKTSQHDTNQLAYQDFYVNKHVDYYHQHPFYPFREKCVTQAVVGERLTQNSFLRLSMLPIKAGRYLYKFIAMDKYKKTYYLNKFRLSLRQYGLRMTLNRVLVFVTNQPRGLLSETRAARKRYPMMGKYISFRVVTRYLGWLKNIITSKKGVSEK